MSSGKTAIEIDLQVEAGAWPAEAELMRLVNGAVDSLVAIGAVGEGSSELSVVFSDDEAVRRLNAGWRDKDQPTNVLSFPAFSLAPGDRLQPMLGDVVLAFETVSREAGLEGKPLDHHVSHLLVHGVLHLLGHDHIGNDEAEIMEALERQALARLAIPDPYA